MNKTLYICAGKLKCTTIEIEIASIEMGAQAKGACTNIHCMSIKNSIIWYMKRGVRKSLQFWKPKIFTKLKYNI